MTIKVGTVTQSKSKDGQAVVKVNILGRESEWLPVVQQASSFKRAYCPVPPGTQVLVLSNRYVLGSLFCADAPEPEGGNEHIEVAEYSDGTRISYDTNAKVFNIEGVGELTINMQGSAKVNAQTIELNGGEGVVTGGHICAFTGCPHSDCSPTVTAEV